MQSWRTHTRLNLWRLIFAGTPARSKSATILNCGDKAPHQRFEVSPTSRAMAARSNRKSLGERERESQKQCKNCHRVIRAREREDGGTSKKTQGVGTPWHASAKRAIFERQAPLNNAQNRFQGDKSLSVGKRALSSCRR